MAKKRGEGGLIQAGEIPLLKSLQKQFKPVSIIQQRLIDGAGERDEPQSLLFQHTVLCQTCLPFRDPGDEVRTWERLNGNVHLEVNAGKAMHPEQGRLVPLGLPFGPKARMILMHINQQALKQKTPEIEIQDTPHQVCAADARTRAHMAATCAPSKSSLPGCQPPLSA